MNHIFKKIWNKSLGRMIVVSENAKSAGKTDNTTGIQQNSLSNVHDDEQGKSGVFSFKPFVLQSLALSIAMILGGNTQADDNYAHASTETALGSAKGTAHGATYILGKITAVGGITVTTTGAGTSLNDIDSFTANGVTTTKAANPTAVAAFINAAKKGGNIAVGQYSSAVGTANIASGSDSSAVGYSNTASGNTSSAVGFNNTASGISSTAVGTNNSASGAYNTAVGYSNTTSNGDLNNALGAYNTNNGATKNTAVGIGNIIDTTGWGTNALGYSNSVGNSFGSAIGTKNTVTLRGSNAIGLNNAVTGSFANAMGTGNTVIGQNGAAVGSGLADYAGNLGPQALLTPVSYTPTFSSVGGVTTLDGVVIKTSAADWAALSANPSLLTEVNGQSLTAAQATDIINNFKQGGNLALSNRSSVFGINSKAVAAGATAIGLNSVADEANTVSVGRAGATKRITNVATPVNATDATNKAYVDTALSNFTANADTVLYDTASNQATLTLAGASGTKITNLQDATLDANSKDAVTGKQLHATNTALTDGLALKADQTALTTGLSSTLADAKTYADTGLALKADQTALTTGLSNTLVDAKTYADTGLALKADQTALTTGLANTLTDAKGYTDVEVGKLDTKLGTEVGTLNTRISNEVGTLNTTISGIDGRVTTNTNDIALLKTNTGNLAANAVIYDSATKDTITLAGTNGTKLTGLQDATLDATSKDAVTGKQLHATNTSVTTLSDRVTTEVDTLNTAITTSANTINTRIDGVDTRIGNEVTTLNTRVDTTNTALVQALGGGAAWNNGVFTNPTFTIQGKAKNTVSDAFIAVDQQLGAIKTSVSDLKTHTDQQAVSNLNDAKNYADQQTTTALNNAKGYTDQKTTSTLNDAKSYADQKAADGKAYTDQQTASTLNSAKNYADQKAADGKAYTDQQTASVLNDAKSYTDQKAASSLSGAKDYTDQQTASALSSANSYTDGKIADVQTQIIASNQFVQVNGVTDAQAASATGENSVAIGTNTVVTGHRSTAVGVGNQVSGNGSGAFGDPNTVSGNGSYVVGNDNKVTGDNTFVLGNNVDTQAKNAVVLGNDSASDRDNTVSVGAKGKERQIIHVADAFEDTDAVNYQQLKAAEKSTNNYTNERVNALNSAFNDYRMETEQRFHKVDERFNRQGAMTAAMMNMSSSAASVKGQNRVGVGAGFQGQEQAVSIGYQRIINDNTSLTIGGAFTKEESSGGVGVGFGW